MVHSSNFSPLPLLRSFHRGGRHEGWVEGGRGGGGGGGGGGFISYFNNILCCGGSQGRSINLSSPLS